RRQLLVEITAELVELAPTVHALHRSQRGQAGRHRDRVAGQGAGLIDAAFGRQVTHDVAAAAESADRHAAADDLAERRKVGRQSVMLRGAARAEPETADDL